MKSRFQVTRARARVVCSAVIGLAALGCDRAPRGGPASSQASTTAPAPSASAPAPTPEQAAALSALRERLEGAARRYEGCSDVRAAVGELDAWLDARSSSSDGYQLLGEALVLAGEVCAAGQATSRHAVTAGDAFAAARAHGSPDAGPITPACSPEKRVDEGRALEREGNVKAAAEAYRRALYEPCSAGLHWHGRTVAARATARLGLARTSTTLGDALAARRQLVLLDFERAEASLKVGDPEEEAALRARLGPAAPAVLATPEPRDAVLALDRAAAEDDGDAFVRLLSSRLPARALLTGRRNPALYCDKYADLTRSHLRACILARLLPEAPREAVCVGRGQAVCTVTGESGADPIRVFLVLEKGLWKIERSEKTTRP